MLDIQKREISEFGLCKKSDFLNFSDHLDVTLALHHANEVFPIDDNHMWTWTRSTRVKFQQVCTGAADLKCQQSGVFEMF